MPGFEIASPLWLLLLLALVPVLLLRIRGHLLARRGAPGLVSPRLREQLVTGSSVVWRWLRFSLFALAFASVTVALARPRWGFETVETQSHGRNILIAIDTSRSMLANDVSPSRLDRAKLAAEDIVRAVPGDRVGLIAFAGGAFVQAPLTVDHAAVIETLRQFDTELIPRGGTNLGSAVQIAIDTFKKADVGESALVLFSDGEDLEGGEQLAVLREQAAASGMTIVAIAVGTEAGSIIPDPEANEPGVFVKDDGGQIVRTRLNPLALQAISAESESGLYLALDSRRSISSVVAASLSQLESTTGEEVERERRIERFGWFLGLGLLLFAAGWVLPDFRRSHKALSSAKATQRRSPTPSYRSSSPAPTPTPSAANGSGGSAGPPSLEEIERMKSRAGAVSILAVAAVSLAFFSLQGSAFGQGSGTDAASPEDSLTGTTTPKLRDPEIAAREALEAMQDGSYKEAASAYRAAIDEGGDNDDSTGASLPDPELNFGLGSAAYKLGDYETAKQAFSRALASADRELATRAQYNLANTLFRHGETFLDESIAQPDKAAAAEQWTSALEHYRGALKMDPRNRRARHNVEVVNARLELLKQEQQQEEEKQQQEDKEDEKKEDEEDEEDPPDDEEKEKEKEEDEKEEEQKDDGDKQDDQQQKDDGQNGRDKNQDQNDKQDENNSDNDSSQDPKSDSEGGQQPPPDGGGDQGSDKNGGKQPPPEGGNENPNEQDGDSDQGDSPPPSGSEGSQPPPTNPDNGKGDQQNGDNSKAPDGQPNPKDSSAPPDSKTEEPPDGELEANPQQQSANNQPAQPQNANPGNTQAGNASQQEGERDPNADLMNAETGYTPSEARRLLRTQSEEALRMLRQRMPQSNDRYRNW